MLIEFVIAIDFCLWPGSIHALQITTAIFNFLSKI